MIVSGAGSAPARSRIDEIVGRLHREAAGNLAGAAGDRFADHGRGNHLVVEHDRKGLPDILGGGLREFARARGIEAEADDRLARALVEAGLRVGQIAAGNQHLLLDRHKASSATSNSSALRNPAAPCPARLIRRHGRIDHAEFHLGGLAEQMPSAAVGSCKPGTCTRMRSVPWRWISGSTVPSSLTRRSTIWIDCSIGLADALGNGRLRNRQPDQRRRRRR